MSSGVCASGCLDTEQFNLKPPSITGLTMFVYNNQKNRSPLEAGICL